MQNKLELVHDRDNDLLAVIQQILQFSRAFCPSDCRRYLHELPDCVLDLLIKINAVCHNDNGIKDQFSIVCFQVDQLMCQPGNRIGLSGTSRMLDQIPSAHAVTLCICQQRSDKMQLVISWKDLLI